MPAPKKKKKDAPFPLRETILAAHSRKQTNIVINWVGEDPKRFAGLMKLFLGDEYRVTQLASNSVSHISVCQPKLIRPYLKKIIANLNRKGQHIAVTRNTIRLLQFIEVPKNLQGDLVNACFNFLLDVESPIALKAFSMKVLYNIAKEEPDLKNEIKIVIEGLLPYGSTAVKNRGQKILKALDKL